MNSKSTLMPLTALPGPWNAWRFGLRLMHLPFDAARALYAQGVRTGLIERSMLASRDVEQGLAALERATLGPLARRV